MSKPTGADKSTAEAKSRTTQLQLYGSSFMNLSLLDPPKWGWSAIGGVTDLLTPQERSRRRSTHVEYRKQRRRAWSCVDNSGLQHSDQSLDVSQRGDPASGGRTVSAAAPIGNTSANPNGSGTSPLQLTNKSDITSLPQNGQNGQNADQYFQKHSNIEEPPSSQFWGMSLKRLSNETNGNNELSSSNRKSKPKQLEAAVHPVEEGVLDMYAYHRGREGMEPRDDESGELLCTQLATDTNHNFDAPKLQLSIMVEFPLEDEEDIKDAKSPSQDETKTKDNHSDIAMYKELMQWDLTNPSTPSPLIFATNIANDFGLSFGQMMDLALSIQGQIDAYLQQHFHYSVPLASKDPHGNERRLGGPVRHAHRFDQVLRIKDGGIPILKKDKRGIRPHGGVLSRQKSSISPTSTGTSSNPRRQREKVEYETIYLDDEEEEIEEIYCQVIRERSKEASTKDIIEKSLNRVVGLLERKKDSHCHICHKRAAVAYTFACGNIAHSYCKMHCKNRLGIEEVPNEPFVLNYCPICSLNCTCSSCCRKSGSVSRDFKRACKEQNTEASKTVFDNILEKCLAASGSRGARVIKKRVIRKEEPPNRATAKSAPPPVEPPPEPQKSSGRKPRQSSQKVVDSGIRPVVPKPSLLDFPREVCGLQEVDPGTPDDYMRLYTAEGSFPVDNLPEAWTIQKGKSSIEEQGTSKIEGKEKMAENASRKKDPADEECEDGNVDYCHKCQTAGNLICCDYCPRAFHHKCLGKSTPANGEELWRCIICEQESRGLEDDLIDEKASLDRILTSFHDKDVSSDEALKGMIVLSIIHQMLLKLIDYDFGFMFQRPVDEVKGYRDIVKHPMDLGTICSKLLNGGYANILEPAKSFDDVVIAVLKDVELVWHNCFFFNFVGSAIYRMADVHRRRAQRIRSKSFDHLLSDRVKSAVQKYVSLCERQRGEDQSEQISLSARENALRLNRPKGKHEIAVKKGKQGVSKIIAILDPACGRIVKMYSSMKYAIQAAHLLSKLGHKCEWSSLDVKTIINQSSSEPLVLLFGYRWLLLDDLRAGKVKFSKPSNSVIEMKYDDSLHLFLSIDEALSFSALPKQYGIEDIRRKLLVIPLGPEWVDLFGKSWRRPLQNEKSNNISGETSLMLDGSMYILKDSVVVKEDVVTCRKLVGFGTISAAFDDWIRTITSSPTFPDSESQNIGNFKEFYLDGDRNIDGFVWKSTKPPPKEVTKAGVPETSVEINNNFRSSCSQMEKSDNAPSVQPVVKPAEQVVLSDSNGKDILRDTNAETNAMDIDSFDDLTKHDSSATTLGKRKRLSTKDNQNNQWNLSYGGETVKEQPQRPLTQRHHGDAIRLNLQRSSV